MTTEQASESRESTSEAEGVVVSHDGRKVTWSYERKVGLADYGSESVSVFITDQVPENMSAMQVVLDRSEPALDILKAQVWRALGLAVTFNEETGRPELTPPPKPVPPRPLEQPGAPPPPVSAPPPPVAQPAAPPTAPQPPPMPPSNGGGGGDEPSMAQIGHYAEFPGFCKDCGAQGIENFYDNRGENDQKIGQRQKIGPDFRCKHCRGGSGKGAGKAIFRPGSYGYNNAVG